jgi:hypothetical protein
MWSQREPLSALALTLGIRSNAHTHVQFIGMAL